MLGTKETVSPIEEGIDANTSKISIQRYSSSLQQKSYLGFKNVNYYVKDKKSDDRKGKHVLQDLSGIMKPGLNAIMGPTGSGKTSLLDVLAGRKNPKGLSGEVKLNGEKLPDNFKRISGYVVQKDIATGTLTVRENLMFCANLRLPRSVPPSEKRELVDQVLFDLGISHCADTKVGDDMIRGISGGEKKRTCIAIELITSPSVLFLDEPTTGLDASTANSVMRLLSTLAKKGRTIIFSIHQPRYSIFRLFDSLTLLAKGKMVYHGKLKHALPHFNALGYQCEEHNNPADFFLDVVNGDTHKHIDDVTKTNDNVTKDKNDDVTKEEKYDITKGRELVTKSSEDFVRIARELNGKYLNSDARKRLEKEFEVIGEVMEGKANESWFYNVNKHANPIHYQLKILMKRAALNVIRNPAALAVVMAVNVIIGLLYGVLFFQIGNEISPDVQNRFGVLFNLVIYLLFGSISSMEVFLKEKEVFAHEYASGYYRVFPYFLSKVLADLIPIRTLGPIFFAVTTYWMVGLRTGISEFFTFLIILLALGYASVAMTMFFTCFFSTFVVANTIVSLVFVFSVMFAGLLLNVDSVLPWLAWIQHISIARFAYNALAINEFSGTTFTECIDPDNLNEQSQAIPPSLHCTQFYTMNNLSCVQTTGECFLQSQLSIGDGITVDGNLVWYYVIIVFSIAIAFFIMTYFKLARTKIYS